MYPMKISNQVPVTAPGKTVFRCKCGRVRRIDGRTLIYKGLKCKCGFCLEPRQPAFIKAGKFVMDRNKGHERRNPK